MNYFLEELKRRQLLIQSEPEGIVRDTMIDNLLIDWPESTEVENGWVKVEENPTEEGECLLRCEEGDIFHEVGFWDSKDWNTAYDRTGYSISELITHWRPLPAPPHP